MSRRKSSSLVYLGIRGHVIALSRMTGDEMWRTELKGSTFVQVFRDQEYLYAAARGEVFCLSPETGEVLWHNPLKGLGWDLASIATDAPLGTSSDIGLSAASITRQRQAAAAS